MSADRLALLVVLRSGAAGPEPVQTAGAQGLPLHAEERSSETNVVQATMTSNVGVENLPREVVAPPFLPLERCLYQILKRYSPQIMV
jgi:hypothetical protein